MRLTSWLAILAVLCVSAAAQDDSALMQGVKGDKSSYELEESVTITYGILNRGNTPLVYTFSTSKQYDAWVMRGSTEIWRLSKGKYYAQIITNLTLQPGQSRNFEVKWDQRDNSGKQVGPGTYALYAQLTPTKNQPSATTNKIKVGLSSAALVPVTIRECIARASELLNRRVTITGIYRGYQPDSNDPNCKDGPPVTKSDWAISDNTGCMYVTGSVDLNPQKDVGTKISVIGKVQKTSKGQVYLILESATIQKCSATAQSCKFLEH